MDYFFERFKNEKLRGWALWVWDYLPRHNPNFVFVDFDNGGPITTNDNFEYIRNGIRDCLKLYLGDNWC